MESVTDKADTEERACDIEGVVLAEIEPDRRGGVGG